MMLGHMCRLVKVPADLVFASDLLLSFFSILFLLKIMSEAIVSYWLILFDILQLA